MTTKMVDASETTSPLNPKAVEKRNQSKCSRFLGELMKYRYYILALLLVFLVVVIIVVVVISLKADSGNFSLISYSLRAYILH